MIVAKRSTKLLLTQKSERLDEWQGIVSENLYVPIKFYLPNLLSHSGEIDFLHLFLNVWLRGMQNGACWREQLWATDAGGFNVVFNKNWAAKVSSLYELSIEQEKFKIWAKFYVTEQWFM